MKLKQNFDILGSVAYSAVKGKRLNCSGKRIRKDNDMIKCVYFYSRPNSDKLINKILWEQYDTNLEFCNTVYYHILHFVLSVKGS